VAIQLEASIVPDTFSAEWDGFSLDYRHRDTPYRINLRQSDAGTLSTVWLDGVVQADGCITLVDDGVEHCVELNHPRAR